MGSSVWYPFGHDPKRDHVDHVHRYGPEVSPETVFKSSRLVEIFGTSVFFNIFIFSVWPEDRFTQALGITCILLDLIHIYLVSTQKWKTKALEQQASIA